MEGGAGNVPLSDIMPSIMPGQVDNLSDYAIDSESSDGPDYCPPPTNSSNQSTGDYPSKEEFGGVVGFSIVMDLANARRKWEFSTSLKKLFVRVDEVLPITFRVDPGTDTSKMIVRAVMVYDNEDDWMHPVMRCPLHSAAQHKRNEGYPFVNHVLCCEHRDAEYNVNKDSKRYSVAVPFGEPQPGSTCVTFIYGFKCKSSCEGGINRRNTSIIFTLEQNGEVKGRQVMKVKISSCPGRDMAQDELHMHGDVPKGKKRKHVQTACKDVKKEVLMPHAMEPTMLQQPPPQNENFILYLEVRDLQLYKKMLTSASNRYLAAVMPRINFYKKLVLEANKA